jgi:ABC-type branched-subunit amino acid transport system ATPase component
VFQQFNLVGRLDVLTNLLLGRLAHRRGPRAALAVLLAARFTAAERAMALEVLERFGLLEVALQRAETLSGGQKKLLELARVLMGEPRMILLDEPGAGVNPTLMRSLVDTIRALRAAGRTFLLIEHDMDLVTELCDPVIVMAQGRVLAEGSMAEMRANAAVVAAYLSGQRAQGVAVRGR